MKVRIQGKKRFSLKNRYLVWQFRWDSVLKNYAEKLNIVDMSPEAVAARVKWFEEFWADLTKDQKKNELIEEHSDPVEAVKQEFVVVKKSTGEVVASFDVREDAEEMIEKAKRQKKATLVLLNTLE